MNHAIYEKCNGELEKQNRCKTCKQQKRLLKWTSKPSHMSHKIIGKNFVTIHKSKFALMLKKPVYIDICILDVSKVLHKFHHKSRLLFPDTDSLMYEIRTEEIYENFSNDKEVFDFSNYSTKSKYNLLQRN